LQQPGCAPHPRMSSQAQAPNQRGRSEASSLFSRARTRRPVTFGTFRVVFPALGHCEPRSGAATQVAMSAARLSGGQALHERGLLRYSPWRGEGGAKRMKNWNVRKAVVAREDMAPEHRLKQSLSWPHLVALGVGAIVGTGILTLIGVGAGKAGPAVILSFAIAGVICACAALAYAEVATMIPASGSAYTYS